ncbi:chemotaxis protein methyltransferase CheR [Allopseudospirillum japonicum]|uniref:Chemotaxis protein methyltransferase n=1 Tax=Allopseudospirillum japonicum TaxID=64971 RepID=A0A1H6S980_9GAMM|nr:CheR family methyltransferase [Allopseudospirillum japonicum]SEI60560.1 chemotaxis protein methyltransferase CheR [Allopseudospirillum japonicum]
MSTASKSREFHFTLKDFHYVRDLIYREAGIVLVDAKADLVYTRLSRRLRVLNIHTFSQYIEFLNKNPQELETFINALTTNLTSFFREAHHFELLKNYFTQWKSPIRIWCTASSTGEEAYSLAMTAMEYFGTYQPPVEILASDIDTDVLRKAAAGIYAFDRISDLDEARRKRFFLKGCDKNLGKVKVRRALKDLVKFQKINLLAPQWPIQGPFHAIFCRNVMIYFDKPTQYKILAGFHPLLTHDGVLFAGHSESFHHATDLFQLVSRTVYRPILGRIHV